ncbi:MAG: (E)-4-hydroxy-3-methylbut-2-enyl-diphosphate synthase [Clostridia bacterium]|jgi:(E)-4-hydroxy-3-methylbut-2-enyl-diphosphate synthase|nr:(E)-4-hydroxy-3-methylbut-2-enyl-diphosphate synthase [Clostridia bacterium]MDN5324026.1 (E)-4-hydroxy-3-methylbut-2-enyl-diphosphate synthase [Clostridia bacterium]
MIKRRKTVNFRLGNIGIGSNYPVSIQSMTNTDTRDINTTLKQINKLAENGCEIIRVAVPDEKAALSLKDICSQSPVPVVADIHFDYRLAIKSLENGVNGLRINPGNIGNELKIKEVVKAALFYDVPIRIGVNSGSLEKDLLEKYQGVTVEALVESALRHVSLLEKYNFEKIKISLKASYVPLMIEAYRNIAQKVPYPLHLGVTEAGIEKHGIIKSAIGIGALLAEGIGDTIRVSLTGDPVKEIPVAFQILSTLGMRKQGVEIISCPTCGRCQIDIDKLVNEVDKSTLDLKQPLKLAIMGCVVNGPGEAREADIGIAGGKGQGLIFKKGKIIAKVDEDQLLPALLKEIEKIRRSDIDEND